MTKLKTQLAKLKTEMLSFMENTQHGLLENL